MPTRGHSGDSQVLNEAGGSYVTLSLALPPPGIFLQLYCELKVINVICLFCGGLEDNVWESVLLLPCGGNRLYPLSPLVHPYSDRWVPPPLQGSNTQAWC